MSVREHVVRHDRRGVPEPERRELREHLALVRNARAEHVVERRDPIGGDEQQAVAEVEQVADLAVTIGCGAVEAGVEEGSGETARGLGRKGGS